MRVLQKRVLRSRVKGRTFNREVVVKRMYSLLDKKGGFYGAILLAETDGLAGRQLDEMFRGQAHTVAKFPADFDLYEVAVFDELSGGVSSEGPRFVCNMSVVLESGS